MFGAARWRLALWFAGAFAVLLVLIGGAVYFTTRAALYDQVDDDLRTRNLALQTTLIQQSRGPLGARIQREEFRLAARLLSAGGYSAAIVVEGEETPVGTANIEEIMIPPFEELVVDIGQGLDTIDTSTSDGEDIRLLVERLGPNSFITVGRSIEPEQQALNRLVFVLAAGGLLGLVLACGGGFMLSGRALRPIRRAMDAQRTFVADASHELRTPLSLIRANAEIMKREAAGEKAESVDDIIKEADHLNYLVGQMLTLARADVREAPFASEDVDLSHLS